MLRKAHLVLTVLLAIGLSADLMAQSDHPAFFFGGNDVYYGMRQRDALMALSACCNLSADLSATAKLELGSQPGRMVGQFILSKDTPPRMLGAIYFKADRVVSVNRPLGDDAYLPSNESVVGFTRAFYRGVARQSGDFKIPALISVFHERNSNADDDVMAFTFPNGREVRITLVKFDKPLAGSDSKDSINLDEYLGAPQPLPNSH